MNSFRDMTFCPYWENCTKAESCHRPLTPEVVISAREWWGGDGAPIAMYAEKPECHEPVEDNDDNAT